MQTVIIGLGAIGRMIVDRLAGEKSPVRLQGVLVRPARAAEAREELASDIAVFTSAEDVIEAKPDMVVECAGQAALKQYGETLLGAGLDLMVVATGALAESDYRANLMAAADLEEGRVFQIGIT